MRAWSVRRGIQDAYFLRKAGQPPKTDSRQADDPSRYKHIRVPVRTHRLVLCTPSLSCTLSSALPDVDPYQYRSTDQAEAPHSPLRIVGVLNNILPEIYIFISLCLFCLFLVTERDRETRER